MQFTISTIALVASLMASQASGMPHELSARAQTCGSTPSATGSQTPLSAPSVSTADACKSACAALSTCKSFVFGLPADASAPICRLFQVPAAQVPAQEGNLEVFDTACTDVPTTAPTTAHPVGQTAAAEKQEQQQDNSAAQGQQQTSQGQQKQQKRSFCGAAPTGPTTTSPSPLKVDQSIADANACLVLCRATSGCNSIEFGKPSANAPAECHLFSTAASALPAPTNGQTFVAYDIGC